MTLEVVFAPIIADLAVEFSAGQEFSACLETGQDLEVDFGAISQIGDVDLDPYDGDYQVRPQLDAQTLDTAQKYMVRDLEVEKIPIYAVSNNAGGTTVTIG